MRDVIYFAEDLIYYAVLGILLAYLLDGMLPGRFTPGYGRGKRAENAGAVLALQFCAVRMAFAWLPYLKRLMYGQDMIMESSKQSLIPVTASLVCSLAAGLVLYRGSKTVLLALTAAFYALTELARFLLYPAAVGSMNYLAWHFAERFLMAAEFDPERFLSGMVILELIWNTAVLGGDLLVVAICVRRYKRRLRKTEGGIGPQEAAMLFVPGLMGLLFTAMLRCILFYYESGAQDQEGVNSIVKNYPELNAIIPCMSFLCIVSVLMSAKMLAQISAEHEKRRQAELYRSQAEELGAHVQDMESVYIRIRGMKHDMKNYIADVNGLLARMAAGDGRAGEEVRGYVESMQVSLEELSMQCATANPVTDVIVGRFMRLAKQKGISFSSAFVYPKHLGIDVFDIGIILNNGLENAMEACEGETSPLAALYAAQKGNMFLITIENTFHGVLHWEKGIPVSAKSGGGHGLGLKNIRCCAQKYLGRVDIKVRDGLFCLTVMLQGKITC